MILIVDGYNMIGAWPEFKNESNLEDNRLKLVDMLSDYAGYTGDRVIVVFDAYQGKRALRSIENAAGIEVVFTKSGETADHYIERLADELGGRPGARNDIRVATSDRIEQTIALGRGAARISASEMRRIVKQGRQAGFSSAKQPPKSTLDERLPPEILEKLERMRNQRQ